MERIIRCSRLMIKDADGYEHSFEIKWFGSLTVELNEVRRDIRVTKQGVFAPKTVVYFSEIKAYQYEEAAWYTKSKINILDLVYLKLPVYK